MLEKRSKIENAIGYLFEIDLLEEIIKISNLPKAQQGHDYD